MDVLIPALVSIESQKLVHVLLPQASFEVLFLPCWKSSVSCSSLKVLIPSLVSIWSQKLVHALLPQASFEVLLLPCWKSSVSCSSLEVLIPALVSIESQKLVHALFPQASFEGSSSSLLEEECFLFFLGGPDPCAGSD